MRVYYLTGAQFALGNLALHRIKIARFSDLNDPFELLAVDLADHKYRNAFRALKDQLNEVHGLICFAKSWSNPLMWGHYAEKHSGICLGFDIDDKFLKRVIYSKTPTKIEIDKRINEPKLNKKLIERLMSTKFHDWIYEDEVRLLVKLNNSTVESGLHFYPFDQKLILREVILGPRCSLPIDLIRNLVCNFPNKIEVIKSRIAFSSFKVIKNKVASKLKSQL